MKNQAENCLNKPIKEANPYKDRRDCLSGEIMNKPTSQEQIGFHKGALSTLAKEREELKRLTGIVEQLMQMHVKSLAELGVDLTKGDASLDEKMK